VGEIVSRRGFSLLEAMLTVGLFALLTTVVMQVMTPGLRIFTLSQTLGEVETRSLAAHHKLVRELTASCPGSVYWVDEPGLASLTFLAVDREGGYDPNSGAPIWRQLRAWFVRQGQLCRRTWQPPEPGLTRTLPNTAAFRLTPAEARAISTGGRALCQGVTSFTVTPAGDGSFRLRLEVEARTQQGRQLLARETEVHLRNQ